MTNNTEMQSIFEGIFQTSSEAIITINKQGIVISFNPGAEKLLGYKVDEVIGQNVKVIMPAIYYSEHDKYLENYLKTGNRKIIGSGREVEVKTKEGEIIPIHLSVSEAFVNNEKIFVGIARDISELKKIQDQFKHNELRTKSILDNAVDAIITIDQNGIIQYANPSTKTLFGYDLEEITGENVKYLMPFPYKNEHDSYLKRYSKTGNRKIIGFGREVNGQKKNGEIFPIHLSVSESTIGSERFFTGIIRDITELKAAEHEIKKANAELEQFAYIASHDLKSPLKNIRSLVGIIQEELKGNESTDIQEYCQHLSACVVKMENLISDLLALSSVGNQEVRFQAVDLKEEINALLNVLSINIKEANAKIIVKDLPIINADPRLLDQVFQNLIQNAIKFKAPSKDPTVEIGCIDNEQNHRLYVKDDGIGIAPDYHEKIWKIFSRLHGDAEYTGTGIGLSIVKKIIDLHRGKIWLESEEGKGTTFYFDIPKVN